MLGRLRWLLVAAIVAVPVTVDLRPGFTWSEASAQGVWPVNCDPLVLNYYYFNRFVGSQVRFRTPPPNCAAPTCVLWGACISEVRLDLVPGGRFDIRRARITFRHASAIFRIRQADPCVR